VKAAVAGFYWSKLDGSRRVLDLGCGDGALGKHKPAGREVHGLEIDPRRVSQLSGYESAHVWDLDVEQSLPFPDEYFDGIVAKDILEHVQKPWVLLREVRRVLAPGGRVVASVICHRSRHVWADYTHVRGFTMSTARQLFSDAGFDVRAVWRMGGVPASARLNSVHLIPLLLTVPVFDWIWTSSYELLAEKPEI